MSTNNYFLEKNQYETADSSNDASCVLDIEFSQRRKPVKTYYASTSVFSDNVPLKRMQEIGELYDEGL